MIDEKIREAYLLLSGPIATDDPMIAAAFIIADAYVAAEARARMVECLYKSVFDAPRRLLTLVDWEKEVREELERS